VFVLWLAGYVWHQVHCFEEALENFEQTPLPTAQHDHLEATLPADALPTAGELPPWTWTSERSANHTVACDGEWKAGCEPPLWCDGTQSTVTMVDKTADEADPRVELTIARVTHMDIDSRSECTIPLRPPAGTEIRVQHHASSVVVFTSSEESLLTWQYDLGCNLVATRAQSSPFNPAETYFRSPPIRPMQHVLRRGVYFRTTDLADGRGCETACTLQVWEAPYDERHSEHELIAPLGIATKHDDDFIGWAYWNASEWFVRVVDRRTHETVLEDRGPHGGGTLRGFYLADGRIAVVVEQGSDRSSSTETRVYDLPRGDAKTSGRHDLQRPSPPRFR
jgi:hypothetical protein